MLRAPSSLLVFVVGVVLTYPSRRIRRDLAHAIEDEHHLHLAPVVRRWVGSHSDVTRAFHHGNVGLKVLQYEAMSYHGVNLWGAAQARGNRGRRAQYSLRLFPHELDVVWSILSPTAGLGEGNKGPQFPRLGKLLLTDFLF